MREPIQVIEWKGPDPDCPVCGGEGWVCEEHTDKGWGQGDGCCGAPGAPCPKCRKDHADLHP